jgi:hypothetical protein
MTEGAKNTGVRGVVRHGTLFPLDPVTDVAAEDEDGRGRNDALNEARNEHLMHRYVYYSMFKKYRYDWILERLGAEFYITVRTVSWVLGDHYDRVAEIKAEWNPAEVKKKYRMWGNWGEVII